MSDMGNKDNPFTHAPEDWKTNGVPYGAWCKCSKCGLVHRSTVTFDCYADGPGEPLVCENCKLGYTVMPEAVREEFEANVLKGESDAE